MSSNLFKGLKPKTKLARNGFDLSQKHVFTTRPGHVVPCLALETVPGDHIEINMANLTRTMTLNTAAFVRGKFNFDFYFVPYTQLWHPFNQFVNQRPDKHSSNQKGILYAPTVSLGAVLELIGNVLLEQDTTLNQASDDIFGFNWGVNALRLLDMLGYGAYYELLGFNNDQEVHEYAGQYSDIFINVFRLAAYQHIWYDFYRNKYFDVEEEYVNLVQGHDYVKYFNFDDIACTNIASSRIPVNLTTLFSNDRIFGLFQQRYVQYKKDLLTSVMPSSQFGAVSSVSFDTFRLNNANIDSKYQPETDGETPTLVDMGSYGRLTYSDDGGDADQTWNLKGTVPSAFDVLQLRKAEVLQKWKQLTLRAGNMVDDNWRAHYGKTPRYENDENVLYLGSHQSQLQINPVESTNVNPSLSQKVGSLGATGTSVANGQKITFDLGDNGDYGVIMCMCYFVPENDYNALGMDKANTLYEQFDFFTPEFENIGLEAVGRSLYDLSTHPGHRNDVLGYAPRYWMYKTALDKVHGNFIDDTSVQGSLQYWVAPRHEHFIGSTIDLKLGTRGLQTFYVEPSIYNNIFGIAIRPDNQPKEDFVVDPFYHNVMFDIKAIRPISSLGLPQF